jgi:hypothetical protein
VVLHIYNPEYILKLGENNKKCYEFTAKPVVEFPAWGYKIQ